MKPSIGRIVHYVNGGVHYAAIVTRVHDTTSMNVDLTVFPPPFDTSFGTDVISQQSYIPFNESGMHHTWHWPEREE